MRQHNSTNARVASETGPKGQKSDIVGENTGQQGGWHQKETVRQVGNLVEGQLGQKSSLEGQKQGKRLRWRLIRPKALVEATERAQATSSEVN